MTDSPVEVLTEEINSPLPDEAIEAVPAELRALAEAAMAGPETVIASDESIEMPHGGTFKVTVRTAITPFGPAFCLEKPGVSQACGGMWEDLGRPQIVAYGGFPVSSIVVWSPREFDGITAVLEDGERISAPAVGTDVGAFAAFAFVADNPPVALLATTLDGEVDLELDAYPGRDTAVMDPSLSGTP